MLEHEFRAKVNPFLNIYWDLQHEVKSGSCRIDTIATHKILKIKVGIEFKQPNRWTGASFGQYLSQLIKYNIQYGIPILVCPPISKRILDESFEKDDKKFARSSSNYHHTVNGLLGVWGIGEIKPIYDYKGKKTGFAFITNNNLFWKQTKNKGYWKEYQNIKAFDRVKNKISKQNDFWRNIYKG